jgi:hypothetical protein
VHWVAVTTNGRNIVRAYRSVGPRNPWVFGFGVAHADEGGVAAEILPLWRGLLGHASPPWLGRLEEDFLQILIAIALNFLDARKTPLNQFIIEFCTVVASAFLEAALANDGPSAQLLAERTVRWIDLIAHSDPGASAFALVRLSRWLNMAGLGRTLLLLCRWASPALRCILVRELVASGALTTIAFFDEGQFRDYYDFQHSEPHTSDLQVLIAQQRALVAEANKWMRNDMFSSVKLYTKEQTQSTPIDFLQDYAVGLFNVVLKTVGCANSFSEWKDSAVFQLLNNFLMLSWSLSEAHTCSQIILPLLHVMPNSMRELIAKPNANPAADADGAQVMAVLGFTVGVFAATLLKGGVFSAFEEKYKWLILPSLGLMADPKALQALDCEQNEFADAFVREFVASSDTMPALYRKWKAQWHRNMTADLLELDKLSLASLVQHLHLTACISEFTKSGTINAALRAPLDQMLRIRNEARAALRERSTISPLLAKCRMLIRMSTALPAEADSARVIGDFIVSSVPPSAFKHFISGQPVRLQLTGIGFSIVEAISAQALGSAFEAAVDAPLSRIANFEGLAGVVRHSSKAAIASVEQFLERALNSPSPFLAILARKLFVARVVPDALTGAFISRLLPDIGLGGRYFGLCYGRVGLVPGVLDGFDPATASELAWFTIADALSVRSCPAELYECLLEYVSQCRPDNARFVVTALLNTCQRGELGSDALARGFRRLLDIAGTSLVSCRSVFRANEIIWMLRGVLRLTQNATPILYDVLHQITPAGASMREMCAVFALLGGSLEEVRPACCVAFAAADGAVCHGVRVGDGQLVALPITPVSRAVCQRVLWAEASPEFSPLLFPSLDYLASFFAAATAVPTVPQAFLYLGALATYLGEGALADTIDVGLVRQVAAALPPAMRQFGGVQGEVVQLFADLALREESAGDFSVLRRPGDPIVTHVSDALGREQTARVAVTVAPHTEGYVGFFADVDEAHPPHVLVAVPPLEHFEFRVDCREGQITCGWVITAQPKALLGFTQFRVVVAVTPPARAVSLDVAPRSPAAREPPLRPFGYDEPLQRSAPALVALPGWATSKSAARQWENMDGLPQPPTIQNVRDGGAREPPIVLDFRQSTVLSPALKQRALKYRAGRLFGRLATIIVARLIALGFAPHFDNRALARVYATLAVAREHARPDLFSAGLFPFAAAGADSHDGALQAIAREPRFAGALRQRIAQMNADPRVHLAGTVVVPRCLLRAASERMLIVSAANFNGILGAPPVHCEQLAQSGLPLLIAAADVQLESAKHCLPVATLSLSAGDNDAVYGTALEILLLLSHHLALTGDCCFARSIIIQQILAQSPLSWAFLPEALLATAHRPTPRRDMTREYRGYLLLLAAFHKQWGSATDQRLLAFLLQERKAVMTNLPELLAPFFPEFGGTGSPTEVVIDPATHTPPFLEFIVCRSVFARYTSPSQVPYWDILPLWLEANPREPTVTVGEQIRIDNPDRCTCSLVIRLCTDGAEDPLALIYRRAALDDPAPAPIGVPVQFDDAQLFVTMVNPTIADVHCSIAVVRRRGPRVSAVRDAFVSDILWLIREWTPAQTSELVATIASERFQSPSPAETIETAVTALPGIAESGVRLIAVALHRLNYIRSTSYKMIPPPFWTTVRECLSSDEAIRNFVKAIPHRGARPDITIDRHGAHALALAGSGSPSLSVIAQFASIIARRPAVSWQSHDPWHVAFTNERAIDAGGPRKELFGELAQSIFEKTSQLVVPTPNGRNRIGRCQELFLPAAQAAQNVLYAVGVYLGVILRTGFTQDLPFAPVVWRVLASDAVNEEHIVQVDNRLAAQFARVRAARGDADFARLGLKWEAEDWEGDVMGVGRGQTVAAADAEIWISRVVQARIAALETQIGHIARGLKENVGMLIPNDISGPMLSQMCQGSSNVSVEQLRKIVVFTGFRETTQQMFWQVVGRMTNVQRSLLFRFATSLSRMPRNAGEDFRITITRQGNDNSRLPGASTCFNRMYLPEYSSADIMYQKLVYAIETCCTMENA